MSIYRANHYTDYILEILKNGKSEIPHGSVKGLAKAIQCHPTFISQVLRQKSFFNHEQALRFCEYADSSEDETAFFIDLLNRDRAATVESRKFFDRLIEKKLNQRSSLKQDSQLIEVKSFHEKLYYHHLIYPLIHSTLHLPKHTQPKTIADTLGLSISSIEEGLELLAEIGLAKKGKKGWAPLEKTLHISKGSLISNQYHSHWRLKVASLLANDKRTTEHTHFSSVYAISAKDAERIRKSLLEQLETARKQMIESEPEILYSLCLDFFPISNKD